MLKAHLWDAWNKSGGLQTPTSLRAYMVSLAASKTALLAAGQVKSNIANSHTTEFGGNLDAEQVVQLWVYLVDLFDIAVTELQAASPPIPAPTDAQVKAQMELDLRPIYGTTDNFMWMIK